VTDARLGRESEQVLVHLDTGDVATRLGRASEQVLVHLAGGDITARLGRISLQVLIRNQRVGWDVLERNPTGP